MRAFFWLRCLLTVVLTHKSALIQSQFLSLSPRTKFGDQQYLKEGQHDGGRPQVLVRDGHQARRHRLFEGKGRAWDGWDGAVAQERDGAAASALQRQAAQGQGSGGTARFPRDNNGAFFFRHLRSRYRGRRGGGGCGRREDSKCGRIASICYNEKGTGGDAPDGRRHTRPVRPTPWDGDWVGAASTRPDLVGPWSIIDVAANLLPDMELSMVRCWRGRCRTAPPRRVLIGASV